MKSRIVFGALISAILLTAASFAFAAGRSDPAAYRLVSSEDESVPPAPKGLESGYSKNFGYQQVSDGSETSGGDACSLGSSCDVGCSGGSCKKSCCCPLWTATADALFYDRVGAKSRTIIPSRDPNQRDLKATDYDFDFNAGPRVSLIRHGCRCFDVEVMFFMVDGWSNSQSRVLTIPDVEDVNIDSNWNSRLYNTEINLRYDATCRITLLAGFRWSLLREKYGLQATGINNSISYDLNTDNNLYGFQIGADMKLMQYGCFHLDGLVKAGIYDNRAEKSVLITNTESETVYNEAIDHAAFMGELGLQGCYQLTDRLTLRAGYQVMWIDGVALAPSQWGLGESIDAKNTVFYHGANAGFEYKF
jgi:hypothetical protein